VRRERDRERGRAIYCSLPTPLCHRSMMGYFLFFSPVLSSPQPCAFIAEYCYTIHSTDS
jgi:hypothetical protein